MEKIFYTRRCLHPSSEYAVKKIVNDFFKITNATILKTSKGKPYLLNEQLFFSVSHTETTLFIAFSDNPIGLDSEEKQRKIDYSNIVKKFPLEEADEITSTQEFLRHWVAKESAIKQMGGSLANDLKKTAYIKKQILFNGEKLPLQITEFDFNGHFLAICCEKDFKNAEFISI